MTKTNKLMVLAIAGALLLSGFAVGRVVEPSKTTAAEDKKPAVTQLVNNTSPLPGESNKVNEALYLSDYKTGYSAGYSSGSIGEEVGVTSTDRAGYNEGFKQGYADGYKSRMNPEQVQASNNLRPVANGTRYARSGVVYRTSAAPRKRNSTLKTVLTIAAPAAVGAGVGAAVGGKKGAGVGALLGGGGGAIYHLIKNRNNN
jgi:hypothetical protein